jgi:hypothetical protein
MTMMPKATPGARKAATSEDQGKYLGEGFTPSKWDVICHKGRASYDHGKGSLNGTKQARTARLIDSLAVVVSNNLVVQIQLETDASGFASKTTLRTI